MSSQITASTHDAGATSIFVKFGKVTKGVIILNGKVKSWHDEVSISAFEIDFDAVVPLYAAIQMMKLDQPETFFEDFLRECRPDLLPKPLGPRPIADAPKLGTKWQ